MWAEFSILRIVNIRGYLIKPVKPTIFSVENIADIIAIMTKYYQMSLKNENHQSGRYPTQVSFFNKRMLFQPGEANLFSKFLQPVWICSIFGVTYVYTPYCYSC